MAPWKQEVPKRLEEQLDDAIAGQRRNDRIVECVPTTMLILLAPDVLDAVANDA
jgi:hypothetical protein